MANRIKGITIEIDGSVQGLDKSLKEVNSSLSTTQRNLKDVDRLLKLDPKNTELLQQKQKLLADAVDGTRDKLDKLKDAEKQAKAQMESGDLGKDKYDALQREIVETEEKLKSLEKAQKSFGDGSGEALKAVGGKVKAVGDNITSAGEKIMPLSAAVTGLGAVTVKTAADFDASMSKVAAVSGATGEDFDKLRDKAREMGSKTKFSASEAADAMNYMSMAGWKTEDMLTGIEGIMDLAAASGEDLATTSDIVTDALTAFGLSAEDSGHFADVLAAASSNANTNVSMLGESFKYAAPVAGALGISAEDTSVALGLMANAGIKASQSGTALRTGLTNLAKPTKQMQDFMDKYNIALVQNEDGSINLSETMVSLREKMGGLSESEQAAAASAIFGKNSMAGWLAIINASDQDFDKLTSAIDNCDGTAKEMSEIMQDNLSGQMASLQSQLQELAISFGEALMPMIREVVSTIQAFVDKLNNMSEGQRNAILYIGMFVAALGPVLMIVGSVISTIGSLMTVLGVLGIGLTPFLAGGAIIIGIIAAAALIITHWDQIKEAAGKLKETVSEKFTQLKTNASNAWSELQTSASEKWNSIKDKVSTLSESMRSTVANNATSMKDSAASAWNAMKDNASNIFSSMQTTASNSFESIKNSITGKIDSAKNTISDTIDKIKSLFSFDWDLPDLELPHINVGSYITVPVLGTIPDPTTLSVDWYAKAMDTAMILRNPTIFGYQNGSFLGGGEAGEEVVAGKQTLLGMVKDAVRSVIGTTRDMSALASQNLNIKYGDVHMTVYGAPGQDVRQLADIVERRLKGGHDREEAVWA